MSPNELSFASVSSWKSVYGVQKGAPITKNEFWDMIGLGFDEGSLGSERDYHLAAQKRDLFSDALSNRNLVQQEPIMQQFVSLFIDKIGKLGNTEEGMDMSQWLLYFSFDIGTKMAFGESFACLTRGECLTYRAWRRLKLCCRESSRMAYTCPAFVLPRQRCGQP